MTSVEEYQRKLINICELRIRVMRLKICEFFLRILRNGQVFKLYLNVNFENVYRLSCARKNEIIYMNFIILFDNVKTLQEYLQNHISYCIIELVVLITFFVFF